MLRTTDRRTRPGFTLVELLVAAAVCVLIMAILAGAFSLGIDTVRHMKSAGDMMDQLRGASIVLRDDLKARHFHDESGKYKLSDLRHDQVEVFDKGAGATPQYELRGWKAPAYGFFRIRSTPITGTQADADGLTNGTGVATDHYLQFTSIVDGSNDENYYRATAYDSFEASLPYYSTVAEIAYFLEGPVGTTPDGANGLYRLIRRQRLAALADTDRRDRPWPHTAIPWPKSAASNLNEAVISLRPSGQPNPPLMVSTLADLTDPVNRLGRNPNVVPTSAASDTGLAPMLSRPGEDTVVSNVLSFEVQVAYVGPGSPGITAPEPTRPGMPSMKVAGGPYPRDFTPGGVTESPFDSLPPAAASRNNTVPGHTYDSWTSAYDKDWTADINQTTGQLNAGSRVPPLFIRINAVQIRIRVWDQKMQTARQITITQDL